MGLPSREGGGRRVGGRTEKGKRGTRDLGLVSGNVDWDGALPRLTWKRVNVDHVNTGA